MMKIIALLSLAPAILLSAAAADVVHLDGGIRHAGPTTCHADGSITIRTLRGDVTVDADEILRVEDHATLLNELKRQKRRLKSDDAAAATELCQVAIDTGLFDAAFELADQALRAAARSGAAVTLPRPLFDLPVRDVPVDAELSDDDARRLLLATGSREPAVAMVAKARLLALAPRSDVTATIVRALDDVSPKVRHVALDVLAKTRPDGTIERVIERMLFDKDAGVRKAATETAIAYANDGVVFPIVRALEQEDVQLRLAALDAAELLRDTRVVGALVRNLRRADAAGKTRGNFANVTHTSYVGDFDVEIAQAAVIAQPIVKVATHGDIQDVGVAGVFERRVPAAERERTGKVLGLLTGQDLGTDWRRWDAWLSEQLRPN